MATRYRAWTILCGLTLLAATYRLWLPQTAFPQVPLVAAAIDWPPWVDLLAFAAMPCGLLLGLSPQRQRFGWIAFVAALTLAVLSDQHRLQPWAYQFGILAIVFATASNERQVTLARVLAIGVYFHSAHSKLDAAFFDDLGPRIVRSLTSALHVDTAFWSDTTWTVAAAVLPIGELLVAVGLAIPRTRRVAAWVAIVMHAGLLLAFGPWGAGHAWGVLLWNAFFIGQNVLLFALPDPRRPAAKPDEARETPPAGGRSFLALGEVAVGVAVLAPLLEPAGLFDHWPAWAVYSARTERVVVLIPAAARERLPDAVRRHVEEPKFGTSRVRVDRWSLDALGVPVYPQERFRIGVALALARLPAVDGDVRIDVSGVPSRFTGRARRETLRGERELRARAARFLLNAVPRPFTPRR